MASLANKVGIVTGGGTGIGPGDRRGDGQGRRLACHRQSGGQAR